MKCGHRPHSSAWFQTLVFNCLSLAGWEAFNEQAGFFQSVFPLDVLTWSMCFTHWHNKDTKMNQQCFCCIFDFPVISALVIHLRQTEGFVTGRILCSLATDWLSTWHRTNEGGWQKNKTDYKQVEQMLIHSSLWHRQTLFQQQHPETDWGLNITAVGWFGVNCLSS